MCLITEQQEPIILKEDLIVYKLLEVSMSGSLHSWFFSKRWELGELYEVDIEESTDHGWHDAEVLKVYTGYKFSSMGSNSNAVTLIDEFINSIGTKYKCFGPGFHSCTTIERAQMTKYSKDSLFEAVIPKGSEVYFDKSGLVISNKLMIKREIK